MVSVMTEQCVLCKVDVSKGSNRSKWKKCYGYTTGNVRQILDRLCMENFHVPVYDHVDKESYNYMSQVQVAS